MRILLVNKFHYLKGGSEKYYFELAKLLEENGHEVAFFSMQDEKNITTGKKEYFVEKIDLNSKNIFKAFSIIYSVKNKKAIEKAIKEFKPEIVHLNNFQRQLSASIISVIKKDNIPIVYTMHDLQSICPSINMIDGENRICEKCKKGKYINCIKNKCIKKSKLKSILGAIEAYYYKIKKVYTKKIDLIITPTKFYKNKLIEEGLKENKIKVLPNFIEQIDIEKKDDGYALYVGRISKEKGIINLVKAFESIKNEKLYIVGEGPQQEEIKQYIKNNKLEGQIKLCGQLKNEQVLEKISKCKFVVMPSIWYENCPYSLLETIAIGKPVIGSKIGGIPEIVKDNETGLLYEYNNIEELSQKMKQLFEDKELCEKLGKNAKKYVEQKHNKEKYYTEILQIYKSLIKGSK